LIIVVIFLSSESAGEIDDTFSLEYLTPENYRLRSLNNLSRLELFIPLDQQNNN